MKKLFSVLLAAVITASLFSGCSDRKFESVLPPEREFPQAEEYEFTQAVIGDIIVERTLHGNKHGNTLYLFSGNDYGFTVGEKGTVTYTDFDNVYTADGELVSAPQNGMGAFVVKHDVISGISDGFPGIFTVTVAEFYNCVTVPRNAVVILDDEGSALVKKVDDRGLLYDKEIKVGARDSKNYQVLTGLEEGESVVVR